jgi:cysteine desulfurase
MDDRVGHRAQPRAYLDHAATTPLRPEAMEAMRPYLEGRFGNPSGSHDESRLARRGLDDARQLVAELLGADLGEVVFTSGGTESDNLAIAGAWEAATASGLPPPAGGLPPPAGGLPPTALVCSSIEHHAVLNACRALARRTGAELREVPADKDGLVDLAALAEACTPEVGLVSVMAVNNEIGTVQPIERAADLVRDRCPGAVLHTDAVQAVPWIEVGRMTGAFDLVSVSAHKFGGPKGVGALLVRGRASVAPLMHGGGQERERRSGTPNLPGIVAMAAALAVTDAERSRTAPEVAARRDRLGGGLTSSVPGSTWTGAGHCAPGFVHLRVAGVESEALVVLLDRAGVAVSAGAACSSGAVEPSHVLQAMGLDRAEAGSGIRFSLGPSTTDADIDLALAVVPGAVAQLRD